MTCQRSMAEMADADLIAVGGGLPTNAHQDMPTFLGVYKKQSERVNGRHTYVKVDDDKRAIWYSDNVPKGWRAGWTSDLKAGNYDICGLYVKDAEMTPEAATGKWHAFTGNGLSAAPNVRVVALNLDPAKWKAIGTAAAAAASAEEEVSVVSESTPQQRNAEGRKRAIDLNLLDSLSKRPKTASAELQTRVATARSVCSAAVDQRVESLIQPAFKDYVAGKIDAATLDQRKAAARKTAEAEHAPLSALDAAFGKYTAAVAARVAAEEGVDKAMAAEDAAEAEVQAAVRALLPAEAGSSSGVVKSEC